MTSQYEIHVNGKWVATDKYIWRSWTGARCWNGKAWQGERFIIGSDTVAGGKMQDLCPDCGINIVTHDGVDRDDDIVCPSCLTKRENRDYE